MPQRYNPEGEWRPFAQGGDEDAARARAVQITNALDLLGPLFYVFYTGCNVVEFVVRTTVALPQERMSVGDGRLNLYRCPPFYPIQNSVVYDGWATLQSVEVEELRSLLRLIGQTVNRLAFAYQAAVTWRPKYMDFTTAAGYATPDETDLPRLNRFLTLDGSASESALIDAAIDWFNRARGSANTFNAFLGYYVAMEAVAVSIGNGDTDFDLGIQPETRADRRARRVECIGALFQKCYDSEPIRFVERAYFECVKPLRHHMETAARAVLGADGAREIFERGEAEYSLSELRSRIAHGTLALTNPEHESLVRASTPRMARISREFLSRLLLKIPAGEALPKWSGLYRAGFPFTDPRGAWIVPAAYIAGHDWRLRPEWCE